MFTIEVRCLPCLYGIVCEADVGADHPRQLVWEPDASQKRSIGVRLPSRAEKPAAEAEKPAAEADPKGKAVVPRGSVKSELGA